MKQHRNGRTFPGTAWLLAAVLIAGLSNGVSGQSSVSAEAPTAAAPALTAELDTSSMSFYGFYGFYGIQPGNPIECDVVILRFNLYNYGAQDLTSVSTIKYIIDQTNEAVAATFKEAVPTGSTSDFTASITELSATYVTYVQVTVEVDFGRDGTLGGAFASFLGIDEGDVASDGEGTQWVFSPPAPESNDNSFGLDLVVSGYEFGVLEASSNERVAFESALRAAIQSGVLLSTGQQSAAESVTIEIMGLSESGSDGVVAVRLFVHFPDNETEARAAFQNELESDPYGMGNKWGVLAYDIKVVEVAPAIEPQPNPDSSSTRRLLQNGGVGEDGGVNQFVIQLAAAGLGVASIEPSSLECRRASVSSFYGFYGVESSTVEDGVSSAADDVPRGSSVETVESVVEDTEVIAVDSAVEFYGTTSFYGTSFYGTSFYGTSFYGKGASSGELASSDSVIAGSSDMSFYGYSRPSPPRPPRPVGPPAPPPPPNFTGWIPVRFTSLLADYNMADLASPEDLATFEDDYTNSIAGMVRLLGVTGEYQAVINDISAQSTGSGIAVPTTLWFRDDTVGADLVYNVLLQNPALVYPAFSAVGAIQIVNVSTAPPSVDPNAGVSNAFDPAPLRLAPVGPDSNRLSLPGNLCDAKQRDRFGGCCPKPWEMDASRVCCFAKVDECGVCGGDSSTCSSAFNARFALNETVDHSPIGSPAFHASLADIQADVASFLFSVPLQSVEIDEYDVVVSNNTDGKPTYTVDVNLLPSDGRPAPSLDTLNSVVGRARSEIALPGNRNLESAWNLRRVGICGNGVCEVNDCAKDCPTDHDDDESCPVGPPGMLVGAQGALCSGTGDCVQGACKCGPGYTGASCGLCAHGYLPSGGHCAPIDDDDDDKDEQAVDLSTAAQPSPIVLEPEQPKTDPVEEVEEVVPDEAPTEVGAAGVTPVESASKGLGMGAIAGIAVGVLVGLTAVLGVVYLLGSSSSSPPDDIPTLASNTV